MKQVEVGEKENEISAAPQLIADLNLKNKIACVGAMQTQRRLSVEILAKRGDYIWFIKNNQPTLLADAAQFFEPPQTCGGGWPLPELPRTVAKTSDKGHGRLEKRTLNPDNRSIRLLKLAWCTADFQIRTLSSRVTDWNSVDRGELWHHESRSRQDNG